MSISFQEIAVFWLGLAFVVACVEGIGIDNHAALRGFCAMSVGFAGLIIFRLCRQQ